MRKKLFCEAMSGGREDEVVEQEEEGNNVELVHLAD